ncbi:MAG: hypothetical protein WD314_07915 [Trueperaceae bacterium]
MAEHRSDDLPGNDDSRPTDTSEKYSLSRLAQMLDAPLEKVRAWLTDEGIHPVHPDYPEDYGVDAIEFVRLKGHQF